MFIPQLRCTLSRGIAIFPDTPSTLYCRNLAINNRWELLRRRAAPESDVKGTA